MKSLKNVEKFSPPRPRKTVFGLSKINYIRLQCLQIKGHHSMCLIETEIKLYFCLIKH